jgi:hypothetical protein
MSKTDLLALRRNPATLRLYTSHGSFRREGAGFMGYCPFHNEKTPSFHLSQKDGEWVWYCHGCQRGGDIFEYVKEKEHIGSFTDVVAFVQKFLGVSWEGQKDHVKDTFKPILTTKAKATLKTYTLAQYTAQETALASSKLAQDWLQRERGLGYETAKKLHIGFRQKIDSTVDEIQDVIDKGWLAFPSIQNGIVTSIKYRSIARKAFARQFGMATTLFNTNTIDALSDLYITEGEFDAMTLEQAGFHAISIPSAGAEITAEMKDQIMQAGRIILAGDNDNSVGAEKMEKLWKEMQERTYLLRWPVGVKDANQLWTEHKGSPLDFVGVINDLTTKALSKPMANVSSIVEAMLTSGQTNLTDHPKRMRMPWPSIDKMAILLPGSVMSVFATNTKMGKTCFVVNITIDEAMKRGETILNYQCELSTDEMANMVAAYVLKRSRNGLERKDYEEASARLAAHNVKYYIGRDETLSTVTPVLDLIEAGIRRLGATIVILDHIHFICRNDDRQTETEANAMQRIKRMAQQYQVKFIVVGQPRKAQQSNKGKVVHITDWKGSETGVSDSDAVFAIHRNHITIKDPKNPPMDDYEPRTEIHLLGARAKGDGATFALLQFHGERCAFAEEVPDIATDNVFSG